METFSLHVSRAWIAAPFTIRGIRYVVRYVHDEPVVVDHAGNPVVMLIHAEPAQAGRLPGPLPVPS